MKMFDDCREYGIPWSDSYDKRGPESVGGGDPPLCDPGSRKNIESRDGQEY